MKKISVSLYMALTISFTVVILVLSVLYAVISYHDHAKAVDEFSRTLFKEQQLAINTALEHQFNTQVKLNSVATSVLPVLYSEKGMAAVEDYLFDHLRQFTEIAAFFFTTKDNEFSGFITQDNYIRMQAGAETNYAIKFQQVDLGTGELHLLRLAPDFLATTRPWYKSALEADHAGFSDVFRYHAYDTLALPHSLPVYDDAGELMGVVGSNIFLSGLSQFLQRQASEYNGIAVITDENNEVISTSFTNPSELELEFIARATESNTQEQSFINRAVRELDDSHRSSCEHCEFPVLKMEQEDYRVGTFHFDRIPTLNWHITLFIPEQEFQKNMSNFVFQIVYIFLLIFVLTATLSVKTSQLISYPIGNMIRRLSQSEPMQSTGESETGSWLELKEVEELRAANQDYNHRINQVIDSLLQKIEENQAQLAQIQKLALVSQNIDDISIILTQDGHLDWANEKFYQFFGLNLEDSSHQLFSWFKVSEALPQNVLQQLQTYVRQRLTLKNSSSIIIEADNRHYFELHSYQVKGRLQEGNILIMMREITARVRYEEELYLWKEIFEATTVGMAVSKNNDKWIDLVNPAFASMYGGSVQQYQGSNITSFYPDDDKHKPLQYWREANDKGQLVVETHHQRQNGEVFPVLLSVAFVRNKAGEILARVTSVTELTEIKQIQQELFQSQKMQAIGTLAGGIVHDMNNVLGVMLGNAELGVLANEGREGRVAEKSLRYFSAILKAAERGSKLTQQVLSFTRMEAMEMRKVSFTELIRTTIELFTPTLPSHIEVQWQSEVTHSSILMGNESQLQQVMLNLMSNAVKAIQSTDRQRGIISIREFVKQQQLHLHVSDNGCGIEKDRLPFIFDPFFTTESKGKGTGLGLAIVKRILDSHNATIKVVSEPGNSTEFKVCFKSLLPDQELEQEQSLPDLSCEESALIVLVDDEPELLETITEVLQTNKFQVQAFNNAVEARDYCVANADKVDLLFTDYDMPGLTGEQLVRSLLEHGIEMKVIMNTGFHELIEQQKLDALKIDKLLFKPLAFSQLRAEILQVLRA